MPLLDRSGYRPPWGLSNGHAQTLLTHLLRRVPPAFYQRERIETPDGDFLDLDWAARGRDRLAVVSYGMEGSPHGDYTRGMVHALLSAGWGALVWNYRGCSGEPNRKVHFYHGGLIEDLETVLRHVEAAERPRQLALVGFSLGGNLTLSYLGRRARHLPPALTAAVAISAPVDVQDCAEQLQRPANRLYTARFVRLFRARVRAKMAAQPGRISDEAFAHIRTLDDYDAAYTAPHFGFASVAELYRFVSPRPHLPAIRVPTLMISARNDPFLGPRCYPEAEAMANPALFLERPGSGGHLGFITRPFAGRGWAEQRVLDFLAR